MQIHNQLQQINSQHKSKDKERSSEPVILSGRNNNDSVMNSNRSQKFVKNMRPNARENRPDINKMSMQDLKLRIGRLNDEHVVSVYNDNKKASTINRVELFSSQILEKERAPDIGDPVLQKFKKKLAEVA